jgi:hypothetical protein
MRNEKRGMRKGCCLKDIGYEQRAMRRELN